MASKLDNYMAPWEGVNFQSMLVESIHSFLTYKALVVVAPNMYGSLKDG